jgi:hypothetical protein
MLPDFERADRIGEFCGYPESRAFAELLIDYEDDRSCKRVLPRRTQQEETIRVRYDSGTVHFKVVQA